MKTALIILFATGIYFAASAQTKNITQSNGTDKGQYIDGNKEGHWILYYSDSSKKAEGNYKKNKKDGEWKEYYKNGGIMSIAIYKTASSSALIYWKEKIHCTSGKSLTIHTWEELHTEGNTMENQFIRQGWKCYRRYQIWSLPTQLKMIQIAPL